MDYLEITVSSTNYKFYGTITGILKRRNYETVENPGGRFLQLNKGLYTPPTDLQFELFETTTAGQTLSSIARSTDERTGKIYTIAYATEVAAVISNIYIDEKKYVYVVKKPNDTISTGATRLYTGHLTAYILS